MALIKCPNCGTNVLDDTGECFVCGYPLGNPTGPAFTTYTNNPQQGQQDPSQAEGTQAKRSLFGRRKQTPPPQVVQYQERPSLSSTIAGIVSAIKIILLLAVIGFAFFLFYKYQQKQMKDMESKYKQELLEQAGKTNQELADIKDSLVKEVTTVDVEILKELVQPASELVSLKYFYTGMTTYSKDKEAELFGMDFTFPFSEKEMICSYDGKIGVGIEIDKIEYDINNERMVIKVKVPAPQILYHELDNSSFKCYDSKKGLFTTFNMMDYNKAQQQMKDEAVEKLNNNAEYWRQAKAQIETIITGFLTASGELNDYKILYEWKD